MGPLSRHVMGLDPDDRYEPMPRCDHCDRTIWCDEVHHDGYVFCSTDCRDAGKDEQQEADEWAAMTLSQQREAMGGPYGGDGPDD